MMMQPVQALAVLGSTGSVGTQALAVLAQFPHAFKVQALSAGQNMALLAQQVVQFTPSTVVVQHAQAQAQLLQQLGGHWPPYLQQVLVGPQGLVEAATLPSVNQVLVGLVGILGLPPTLAALQAGKQVLTANKETLVTGGHLLEPYRQQLLPLDSEHCALFQCLGSHAMEQVQTLWLTASGGPFRTFSAQQLRHVTKAQALQHPTWVMGAKVTVDCSTLMNKGLELIEAQRLFGVQPSQLGVLVHPQSVVHSLVTFVDGQSLAQLGPNDMRFPILHALGHSLPQHPRLPAFEGLPTVHWPSVGALTFEEPRREEFPCLALAEEALRLGPWACVVLNAANELAVAAFLEERLPWQGIAPHVQQALETADTAGMAQQALGSLDEVLALDAWVREHS